jgi:DNA-binding transcriptional regulator PaaX
MKQDNPLTKILLGFWSGLEDTAIEFGHLASALATHYGSAYRRGGHAYVAELKQLAKEKELRRVVYALKRSDYLKTQKIGSQLILTLTEKGYTNMLAQKMSSAPLHDNNIYTIVIFDIPETQRAARLRFRQLLKQGGFTLLQQSVWVSKRDSYSIVVAFVKRLKLKRWVNVYHATDLLHKPNAVR